MDFANIKRRSPERRAENTLDSEREREGGRGGRERRVHTSLQIRCNSHDIYDFFLSSFFFSSFSVFFFRLQTPAQPKPHKTREICQVFFLVFFLLYEAIGVDELMVFPGDD